ncbi:MAG: hypothetical protein IPH33_10410 [Bacteroidetes bacterium]|nr:hypothetical protein [Bacteroidota bacterium]
MKKIFLFTIALLLNGLVSQSQVTWEKLFSAKNTDVFRSVQEVPSGGYVVAGYTSDSTVSDSDAYVVRMTDFGDTIWTYRQNIGLSRKDLFYKVINTADGGFALCGYTSSITGISDDILIVKLNSSGQMIWTKPIGGSGRDRAQDIVELSNGSFAIAGYTTSPPALYYDAFLYKIDANGDSLWFKRYGTAVYDDANSVRALANGGFLLGGQSTNGANGFDQYLIRTNDSGDTLWTKNSGLQVLTMSIILLLEQMDFFLQVELMVQVLVGMMDMLLKRILREVFCGQNLWRFSTRRFSSC